MLNSDCKGIVEYLNREYKCKDKEDLFEAAINEILKLREISRQKASLQHERVDWYGWEESKN